MTSQKALVSLGDCNLAWLDEYAVAALTGLSVHTLRAHRQKRTGIVYAKIGRSVRYALSDVESFMAAKRITPSL